MDVFRMNIGAQQRILLSAGVKAATGNDLPEFTAAWAAIEPHDQESFVRYAARQRMLPMLLELCRFRGCNINYPLAAEMVNVYRIVTQRLFEELSPAIDRLQDADVPALLLKGGDLALNVYAPGLPRAMDDVDLLVKPPDLAKAVEVFTGLGYVQGRQDLQRLQILPMSEHEKQHIAATHYELAAFKKIVRLPELSPFSRAVSELSNPYYYSVVGDDVYILLEYDVHFNVSPDVDLKDVWYKPRQISLPTQQKVFAQSATSMLWFLAARLYHEVMAVHGAPLRQFIDVLAVLYNFRGEIEWDQIVAIAQRYKMHPSLFYVFWHLNELLDQVIVPESVLNACNPARVDKKRMHDWGDFMPKLLGQVVISACR